MKDKFIAILDTEDEKEFLAYLRSLEANQKKELVPAIKKLTKEYHEFGQLEGNSHGYINGTDAKRELLQYAAFVCFNKIDYDKSPYSYWMVEKNRLSKVLDWYCPDWFSDLVNQFASMEFTPYYVNYFWVMELSSRGFLQPSKELLVKIIPQMLFEQDEHRKWQYKPENLQRLDITLKEHIWYLFEFDSTLHTADRYIFFNESVDRNKVGWISLFKEFSEKQLLDRARLLKVSLLASNRNFNKVLSGWFAELFTALQPTVGELLDLQRELCSVLNALHSKPVNTSLQAIKKIANEKSFDVTGFMDALPILLSAETKSVVSTTLMILEKLAEKHPGERERMVLAVCQSFICQDEAIQSRAAKLIQKYGETSNTALRKELEAYYSGMFTTTRLLLQGFYELPETENPDVAAGEHGLLEIQSSSELTAIAIPATIDDLVFLASQAFDNNEPWHIDILPAALVQFGPKIGRDELPLFAPAFQRAFNTLKDGPRSTTGFLDHLLALFFIDFGNWLIRKFPAASDSIQEIFIKYDNYVDGRRTTYLVSPKSGSYISIWEPHNKAAFYEPYRQLLQAVLDKLRKETDLPVLSTPTHAPCWIQPEVLVERLSSYQLAGEQPDSMDLQVALSRVYLKNDPAILQGLSYQLTGEFLELMRFLLDETGARPCKPFRLKAAWLVAGLTKRLRQSWSEFDGFSYCKAPLENYTGHLKWESVVEPFTYSTYDYQQQKQVKVQSTRKKLSVHRVYAKTEKSVVDKLLAKFTPTKADDPPLLYEYLNFRLHYLSSEANDIRRILALIPNNPEPILADTINKCLGAPEFSEEGDKKMVIAVLQFLYETWEQPGDMSYLMLASSMMAADKTVVSLAGEIWLKAVQEGTIDNTKLGEVLGRHESIEFAPLKRFTDLVSLQLFRVSDQHNQQLLVLIENMLPFLPDAPIKNLKKLLEIYRELLALCSGASVLPHLSLKLKTWGANTGLQKLVQQIIG